MTIKPKVLWTISGITLVVLIALYLWTLTPAFFVQMGRHYLTRSGSFGIAGVYRCDPPETQDCTLSRENLIEAIKHDPRPSNWWPLRAEFVSLE